MLIRREIKTKAPIKCAMKWLFTFFILLICSQTTQAQYDYQALWDTWQDESKSSLERFQALEDYAWYGYLYENPDTTLFYGEILLEFATRNKVKGKVARAYHIIGSAHLYRGDYVESHRAFMKALPLFEKQNNKEGISDVEANIGLIYLDQADHLRALNHFEKALLIKEELKEEKGRSIVLENIANVYFNLEKFEKAEEYFKESLRIARTVGDEMGVASVLNNLGSLYRTQNRNDEAMEVLTECAKICNRIDDQYTLAICEANIGRIYAHQGKIDLALEITKKSYEILTSFGDVVHPAELLIFTGGLQIELGDYKNAEDNCLKALEASEEYGMLDSQKDACKCLYDLHRAQGNAEKALEYNEQILEVAKKN